MSNRATKHGREPALLVSVVARATPRDKNVLVLLALEIVALVLAFVGIPLTYFLTRRMRKRPRLRAAIQSTVLINPSAGLVDRGLQIHFSSQKIDTVSRSLIALWNGGGDTIRFADELASDPLRLQIEAPAVVLDARVLSGSRSQLGFSCELHSDAPQIVELHWNFMDEDDGVLIDMLHTGLQRPALFGTIPGVIFDPHAVNLINLDPARLDWMNEPSRMRRILRRMKSNVTSVPRFVSVVVSSLMWIGLALGLVVSGAGNSSYAYRILSPAHFDLGTAAGQARFADKLASAGWNAGSGSTLTYVLIGFSIFFVLATGFSLLGRRRVVPFGLLRPLPPTPPSKTE